jgi:YD repeat-containing protein
VPADGSSTPSERRAWWPLVWTSLPRAGVSPVTVFDVAELRSVVDVLRVAADLPAVAWAGTTDDDPALRPGVTPIRAVHFGQLREAVADLWRLAGTTDVPEFAGGPIAPASRLVRLSDLLDLRGWVETYEAARPNLAARVLRRRASEGAPGSAAPALLTELWDGAGLSRVRYDADGRPRALTRVIDGVRYDRAREDGRVGQASAAPASPTAEALVAAELREGGDAPVRRDGLGRPILLGDPARARLRLAYDGDGNLAKYVRGGVIVHVVPTLADAAGSDARDGLLAARTGA